MWLADVAWLQVASLVSALGGAGKPGPSAWATNGWSEGAGVVRLLLGQLAQWPVARS